MLYFDKEILMRALTVLNVIVPWFIKTRSLPRSRPVWCRPGRQSSGEVYLSWFEHLWCSVTWGDRWRSWWCLRSGVGMVPVYDFFCVVSCFLMTSSLTKILCQSGRRPSDSWARLARTCRPLKSRSVLLLPCRSNRAPCLVANPKRTQRSLA